MIENEQMITVGIVGEAEVGKTSFINKFIKKINNFLLNVYNPTIAVQMSYGVYESEEGTKIRVKVWDAAGENKYKEVVCYHLKEVNVIIIMYDVTDRQSFEKIKQWEKRLKKEEAYNTHRIIIGNKIDIVQDDHQLRRVRSEEGKKLAEQMQAKFCEVSVKQSTQVEELEQMFENILNARVENLIREQFQDLNFGQQLTKKQSICECAMF